MIGSIAKASDVEPVASQDRERQLSPLIGWLIEVVADSPSFALESALIYFATEIQDSITAEA